MQTLTRRGVGDAAAGLSLHFLHMSEGPFSHDADYIIFDVISEKVPYCGTNSANLDQLFLQVCDSINDKRLYREQHKCFLWMLMGDTYRGVWSYDAHHARVV